MLVICSSMTEVDVPAAALVVVDVEGGGGGKGGGGGNNSLSGLGFRAFAFVTKAKGFSVLDDEGDLSSSALYVLSEASVLKLSILSLTKSSSFAEDFVDNSSFSSSSCIVSAVVSNVEFKEAEALEDSLFSSSSVFVNVLEEYEEASVLKLEDSSFVFRVASSRDLLRECACEGKAFICESCVTAADISSNLEGISSALVAESEPTCPEKLDFMFELVPLVTFLVIIFDVNVAEDLESSVIVAISDEVCGDNLFGVTLPTEHITDERLSGCRLLPCCVVLTCELLADSSSGSECPELKFKFKVGTSTALLGSGVLGICPRFVGLLVELRLDVLFSKSSWAIRSSSSAKSFNTAILASSYRRSKSALHNL
ncbi:hypothetical protein FF38_02895 [Lucilia cuprina]|uniref:Uncharacterized protein n=1 Tax=Lucilia cuprina TaxID=7375 RepID=A0A0L0CNG0_LUCCU|nr:hypothetical protein FF38_02895 [Lucilia cuprina]